MIQMERNWPTAEEMAEKINKGMKPIYEDGKFVGYEITDPEIIKTITSPELKKRFEKGMLTTIKNYQKRCC
jgi:hypothetical protein